MASPAGNPATIPVKLGQRSYNVQYLNGPTQLADQWQSTAGKEFALIDATVDKLHGRALRKALPHLDFIRIASGERSKSFSSLEKIANQLIASGATRKSRLVAIGGGVVGDLTGFLAGVFMRGIPFIQIPTTLLAMVDSSVGGKTAVNITAGKNLVGVFHQPQAVFIIPELLKTLPLRELRCGLSESIKTALIADAKLVSRLEKHTHDEDRIDITFLTELSAACIRIKADIVSKDEKEENIRAYLNFGHTLAHAIEAKSRYKGILHGEAVAMGQRYATLLSRRLGYLGAQDELRIDNLLKQYSLPRHLTSPLKRVSAGDFIKLMRGDKKNSTGDIRLVLLKGLGNCMLPQPVSERELLASLKEFQTLGSVNP